MNNLTKSKQSCKRRRIFVDSDVQAALLRQLAVNWMVVFGVIASVLLAAESYQAGFTLGFSGALAAIWHGNAVLLVTICLLAPFVVYESIKLSHRFAGPMKRFRNDLQRLGNGENVGPLQFREDDFWKDIADGFNSVRQRIELLEQGESDNKTEVEMADLTT
ncbi:MAG TPA: hypothetical protein VMX74_05480 [Pirellulales bacterium]|nr:hypothetical protein [Pirellulales bacterium]